MNYQKTKEILGIEMIKGEQKVMFYNVNCRDLDDLSLLQYIDSQNVRLSTQREELIDLSVKIANLDHRDDTEKGREEIISNFKSGLISGVGLRDMIDMIRERYPWPSSKKIIMIFVSFMTLLFGIGLYVFDVKTDIQFSLVMLNKNNNATIGEACPGTNNTREFILETLESYPTCIEVTVKCFKLFLSRAKECLSKPLSHKNLHSDYQTIAFLSFWHCIQPFLFVLIVFVNKANNNRKKKRSFTNYLFFPSLPGFWKVPIPVLTYIYRFYLDIKFYSARTLYNFKEKVAEIEKEIEKHEASVILALILEASLESNFQFWLQSNYSLPDILVIIVEAKSNYEELINWRTMSILLSFITISYSIIKIRSQLCPLFVLIIDT